MNELLKIHGIILTSEPIGEADRRIVVLSGEAGKISAFVKDARKPNSPFIASTRPFTYGEMLIYQGRNSNSLNEMTAKNFFEDVFSDLESSCYASYFAELSSYYAREGLEAKEMVNLLYASLSALEKNLIPRELVRAIFELKIMALNGEYSLLPLDVPEGDKEALKKGAIYAWNYVINAPLDSLYNFNLEKESLAEFRSHVDKLMKYYIDRDFKSLNILKSMLN